MTANADAPPRGLEGTGAVNILGIPCCRRTKRTAFPPCPTCWLVTSGSRRRTRPRGSGCPPNNADVLPYDAGPVQPVEPRVAWNEGLAVLKLYHPPRPARGAPPLAVPPEWPAVVAQRAGGGAGVLRRQLPAARANADAAADRRAGPDAAPAGRPPDRRAGAARVGDADGPEAGLPGDNPGPGGPATFRRVQPGAGVPAQPRGRGARGVAGGVGE